MSVTPQPREGPRPLELLQQKARDKQRRYRERKALRDPEWAERERQRLELLSFAKQVYGPRRSSGRKARTAFEAAEVEHSRANEAEIATASEESTDAAPEDDQLPLDAPRRDRWGLPHPLCGQETGLSAFFSPVKPEGRGLFAEVPLRFGAEAGTYYARDEDEGAIIVYPQGSVLAAETTLALKGIVPIASGQELHQGRNSEEAPFTEDDAISEAAKLLPEEPLLQTREDYVREKLTAARKMVAGHPDWDDAAVVAKFWDEDDRRVLSRLLALGVRLRSDGREARREPASGT